MPPDTFIEIDASVFTPVHGRERRHALNLMKKAGKCMTARTMNGVVHNDGLTQHVAVTSRSIAAHILLENRVLLRQPLIEVRTHRRMNSDMLVWVEPKSICAVDAGNGQIYVKRPGRFGDRIGVAPIEALNFFYE